ncbi:MAG: type IX secretion system sortase PorU [Desulfobulbaceae bacterium]|nr:type IX secretion system sortase PorU [Candidatus Kapabacteria bacterium]MBS4000371.1 type IX secretion system sortase PorU [Desulfobulbaceae bacterium]
MVVNKFLYCVFVIILLHVTMTSYAQEVSYHNNSVVVKYIPAITNSKFVTSNSGDVYLYPEFESTILKENQFGQPLDQYLPVKFIVPSPDGFSSELLDLHYSPIRGYDIIPFDMNFDKLNDFSELSIEPTFYSSYQFPEKFYKLEYLGISSDHHLAQLQIHPYKYEDGILYMLDSITVKINFDYTKSGNTMIKSNAANAINYSQAVNWGIKPETTFKDEPRLMNGEIIKDLNLISSGSWLKVSVSEEGIYRIDANQVSASGVNVANIDVNTLKIFSKGGKELSELVSDALLNDMDEQAIQVVNKSDGKLDYIIFYGAPTVTFQKVGKKIQHYKNTYSKESYYLLTWGGRNGKRAEFPADISGEIVNRPKNYVHRVFVDEDLTNPYSPGAGRIWFGRTYFSNPFNPVLLHNLDKSGDIFYRFALAHKSDSPGVFNIFDNNEKLGTINLRSLPNYTMANRDFAELTMSASKIGNDNRSIISLQYTNPNLTGSIAYFDYFEIHYPRSFYAIDNELSFIADTNLRGISEFTINGFSGQTIYGFDVTTPSNPKIIRNTAVTGGIFKFVTDLSQGEYRKYYVSSKIKSPKVSPAELINLRGNKENADVIVLTHPDLMISAQEYKKYRESVSDLKIHIVRTDHIYNEFSCGMPDITALRDYIAYAWYNWEVKPQYLVLWGDGHYDMKNIASSKINYIPAHQSFDYYLSSFSEIHSAWSSDDFYGLIVGNDDLLDLSIGRITAENNEDGLAFVDKLKHYENNSSLDQWRSNLLLMADDGPTQGKNYEGTLHTDQSEILTMDVLNKYAQDMQYDKIYLVEYPTENIPNGRLKPKVNQDMLTKINTTGGLVLNWIGHGNPRVWGHEQILDRDVTIPQMTNLDKMFFLTAATCDFGRFDNPETKSGGEDMFLSRKGAAIAVFTSTRIVYSQLNANLLYKLYQFLFTRNQNTNRYNTLGDVVRQLKQDFTGVNDKKYFLLGDPTMKLLMPENQINIDKINGILLSENGDEPIIIPALSKITIEGRIFLPDGKSVDENFNGTVLVTLRDGDSEYQIVEEFMGIKRDKFYFTKLGPSLNRSSYKVENGKFTADFIIPKDISFSDNPGRLFVYAYSEEGEFAKGSYHNLRIDGYDPTSVHDITGPEIYLYLDSRDFIKGDVVTSNPKLIIDLFDESGINSTGIGIGHKIDAWIDDSPNSIDLTERFTTSLTDSRSGSIESFLFGLAPGKHTVKVRAWDVFNNFTIAETNFYISPNGDGSVGNVKFNYPNPFSEQTTIVLNHNMSPPFDVNMKIFSLTGVTLRDIKTSVNTYHTSEIVWDGKDNLGNLVSQGVYIVHIEVPNSSGGTTVARTKIVKIN